MGCIAVDTGRCKGCGLCVGACPHGLIRMANGFDARGYHPAAFLFMDESPCTGCALCARMCPDVALGVDR